MDLGLAKLSVDPNTVPEKRVRFLLRLADDALIHAQRLCEWSGKAPSLEEDLALANVGLDFLGRARLLYQLAGTDLGCSEDELAYFRDSGDYSNLLLLELPRGDFAFTMMRQYLLDQFELSYFSGLACSADSEIVAIAQKTLKEIQYHLGRSERWVRRLGLGTKESNQRAQAALDQLWGYVDEIFVMDDLEQDLVARGLVVDRTALQPNWRAQVSELMSGCDLQCPASDWQVHGGRKGIHTEHLSLLLSEMQTLQRSYPGLQW